jgi:general secretion pathway protein K
MRGQRGGALIAVLWLSAALSAIVFTLSWTVRGELERAGSALDGARVHFLAQGAIERFLLHLSWTGGYGGNDARVVFRPGQRALRWNFPSGWVDLEIAGEGGKLDVYGTPPAVLARLFLALGVEEGRALQLAGGIAAWRQAGGAQNLSVGPSFSTVWPSFLQLEDLLKVPGMTPDIFYGWWERDGDGRLVERGGVARHLTLLGDMAVNVNYASPAVLRAVGLSEGRIAEVMGMRETRIIEDFSPAGSGADGSILLTGGGSRAYTVKATAQLQERPVRRSVAALIRLARNRREPPLSVVRWYPTAN